MNFRDVLVVSQTSSNQIDHDFVESEKRLEKWFFKNSANIIIAIGFIASTPQNVPTTLKRDGSDFSAAIMGAMFKSHQLTIWTNIDGVYSAYPRKVSEAKRELERCGQKTHKAANFTLFYMVKSGSARLKTRELKELCLLHSVVDEMLQRKHRVQNMRKKRRFSKNWNEKY